ncbi:MAG: hypothetical protein HUK20_03980 [Fibrobacter sp.]|nr:hypothetical protein [Fibrobacter sp.]
MNKKKLAFGSALIALCTLLAACIFDADESNLNGWLDDHGMPTSYKPQTLSINNIIPSSVQASLDTAPRYADDIALLGHSSNLTQDLVFDFAFKADSGFIKNLQSSDSAKAFIALYWLRNFYNAKNTPSDILPIDEDLNVSVSWRLDASNDTKLLDSLTRVSDSSWHSTLLKWKETGSADTTFAMKLKQKDISKKDTLIQLQLPSALVDDLKKMKKAAHLQLRLSAPSANQVFRFYGDNTSNSPVLLIMADSSNFLNPTPYRMANLIKNEEDCKDCPILHGGVNDSLVIELPTETIAKALSEFYNEDFPIKGNDVRQTALHAEITMYRNDTQGESEFGLPIQVVVGSFIDSMGTSVRVMEGYKLNKSAIREIGHQNIIFHDGDSLTLQLTYGARDFLNRAGNGATMKFIMRLGPTFLQEKDTSYANYITDKGDTCYKFFGYYDYARYDFSESFKNPMTLKLWLASKREGE